MLPEMEGCVAGESRQYYGMLDYYVWMLKLDCEVKREKTASFEMWC